MVKSPAKISGYARSGTINGSDSCPIGVEGILPRQRFSRVTRLGGSTPACWLLHQISSSSLVEVMPVCDEVARYREKPCCLFVHGELPQLLLFISQEGSIEVALMYHSINLKLKFVQAKTRRSTMSTPHQTLVHGVDTLFASKTVLKH